MHRTPCTAGAPPPTCCPCRVLFLSGENACHCGEILRFSSLRPRRSWEVFPGSRADPNPVWGGGSVGALGPAGTEVTFVGEADLQRLLQAEKELQLSASVGLWMPVLCIQMKTGVFRVGSRGGFRAAPPWFWTEAPECRSATAARRLRLRWPRWRCFPGLAQLSAPCEPAVPGPGSDPGGRL